MTFLRMLTFVLFSLFWTEVVLSSMVSETSEEITVNNGKFVTVIQKCSGMMTSAHLTGSDLELSGHAEDYCLFFPEFALQYPNGSRESWTDPFAKHLGGKVTTTVLVNREEIAIIRAIWDTPYIATEWEYKFIKDKPYFIIYIKRRVETTNVYANAQQCAMFTGSMDDMYITDYEGHLLCTCSNRKCTYPAGYIQHSLFTAIDNGLGIRYPAIVWHDDDSDIVAGVLVTYVTPNQRETISHQNTGIHDGYVEGQWNWFGKSDNESLYLRTGITYGMEMYYYFDYGDIDAFDAFNQALFNENHYDVKESGDYYAASWGGRRVRLADFSWNYPQASNNYICSQELFRYKGISLPRSQNSTLAPEIFDLSVMATTEGQPFDLTPLPEVDGSPPLHKEARTINLLRNGGSKESMIGEVDWEVNSLNNELQYQMFEDSDKLIVKGEISPVKDGVNVKELFVELALPRFAPSRRIRKIDDFTWDIRRRDAIYNSVGITVYNPTGIDTIENTSAVLRLYLQKNKDDVEYDAQKIWAYQFYLFPHLGYDVDDPTQITPLHHKPTRYYREYYKTLPGLRHHNEVGICPDKKLFAYDAVLNNSEMKIKLYATPGVYPIKFFLEGKQPLAVRLDGFSLPKDRWEFDKEGVLTVESDWQGITTIEILLGNQLAAVDVNTDPKPLEFVLLQNYPNPFNSVTTISFRLPSSSEVTLTIYNLRGQKVKTMIDRRIDKGYHCLSWDGRDDRGLLLASGFYLCRLEADGAVQVKKVLLLR